MKINIFTSDGKAWYTDRVKLYPGVELYENVDNPNIEWDVVVVYENLIKESICRAKNYLYICGEPPYMDYYPQGFLNQFDKVLTANSEIKHSNIIRWQQALPFHVGRSALNRSFSLDYDHLLSLKKPEESKLISLIASNISKLPGHKRRLEIVKRLENSSLPIDFYGRGRNFVEDKLDAINPYLFHICIENTSISDYWTEKLADSILCLSVPIYIGCTNIEDYFDSRCLYVAHNYDELIIILNKVIDNPQQIYQEKLPYLMEERKKLLDNYNIIEAIKHCKLDNNCVRELAIRPKASFPLYEYRRKFIVLLLRIGLLH